MCTYYISSILNMKKSKSSWNRLRARMGKYKKPTCCTGYAFYTFFVPNQISEEPFFFVVDQIYLQTAKVSVIFVLSFRISHRSYSCAENWIYYILVYYMFKLRALKQNFWIVNGRLKRRVIKFFLILPMYHIYLCICSDKKDILKLYINKKIYAVFLCSNKNNELCCYLNVET